MEWGNFLMIVFGFYALYYVINIMFDLMKGEGSQRAADENLMVITGLDQEQAMGPPSVKEVSLTDLTDMPSTPNTVGGLKPSRRNSLQKTDSQAAMAAMMPSVESKGYSLSELQIAFKLNTIHLLKKIDFD